MAGIILQSEWLPLIATLPDNEAGALIKAIAGHIQGQEPEDLPPIMSGIYTMMITKIDADLGAYEARCERSRASAQARWAKAKEQVEAESTEEEEPAPAGKRRKVKTTTPDPEVESLVSTWNDLMKPITGKGAVCTPGTQKERTIRGLIQTHGLSTITDALSRLAAEKGWITSQTFFTFDWVMQAENLDKILQGNYDKAQKPAPAKREKARRVQAQLS